MADYRLSKLADRDLARIFYYTIEKFGLAQAIAYRSDVIATLNLLSVTPLMGRAADDVRSGLRRHEHATHVIFFRSQPDGIVVVRIMGRHQE